MVRNASRVDPYRVKQVVLTILIASAAVVAWVAFASGAQPRQDPPIGDGVAIPEAMPEPDARHPGFSSFAGGRPAAATEHQAPEQATAPSDGATDSSDGATDSSDGTQSTAGIAVTAAVAPLRTLVVDRDGDLKRIVSNDASRDPRSYLYVARSGGPAGATVPLTPALWDQARTAA